MAAERMVLILGLSALGGLACGGAERHASVAPTGLTSVEHRVFRQVLVGALRVPPRRLTWSLVRGTEEVRLTLECQVGSSTPATGISLNGQERDEALWQAPVRTVYAGAWERGASEPWALLRAVDGPTGQTGCERLPAALRVRCTPASVEVLAAGAALVPGEKMDDDRMTRPRWEPGAPVHKEALSCALAMESAGDAWAFRAIPPEWPLVFAPAGRGATGVEWAHEHSDQVVQEGAYRFMTAEGTPSP